MRLALLAVAPVTMVFAACGREPVVLLCNNANCRAPIDLRRDDTIEALKESLVQRWGGTLLIDGIEIDTVWDTAENDEKKGCRFTRDYTTAAGSCEADEAGEVIAQHLRDNVEDLTRSRFYVKIQAQPAVAPSGVRHSPEQRRAHAECSLRLARTIEEAAVETGQRLTVIFGEDPEFLEDLMANTDWWTAVSPTDPLQRKIMVGLAVNPPDGMTPDMVSLDWNVAHDGWYSVVHDLQANGIDVQVGAPQITVEAIKTIDYLQPRYVISNDLQVLREYFGPRAVTQ